MMEVVLEDPVLRRRKTDRYERPDNDHDLLTQLWTMFIHNCDEQSARFVSTQNTISDMRREQAENRAATNFRIDGLARDTETKFDSLRNEIEKLRTTDTLQLGAWQMVKLIAAVVVSSFVAAGAAATVVTLALRAATGH